LIGEATDRSGAPNPSNGRAALDRFATKKIDGSVGR
jgi:hypothetical protein